MSKRLIFHIDVNNAFLSWTAVYLLKKGYKTDIRKIPSIIGGDESKRHGIVLAKSPVAKKFGIKTAETIFQARKKCPSIQIFPPNHEWYYKKSEELFSYLSKYSPIIERYSIDECFIDMTGTNYLYSDYETLAHNIKEEVKTKFGYTVNIGIGNNKLCAKMASDFEKPDKVHTLYKEEIETKLWPLDVGDLFMCGQKSKEILNKLNIFTIKDLAYANDKLLEKSFKSQAKYLKEAAWGIDMTSVAPRTAKNTSISTSETLSYDMTDEEKLKEILFRQTGEVVRTLRNKKQYATTVAVIFKTKDFKSYSAQAKLEAESDGLKEIYKLVTDIFDKNYRKEPIRLIGVRLANLKEAKEKQLTLFESQKKEEAGIQDTIDDINKKFGKELVAPASLKLIGK